ncbi:acyltransferase family protein [Vibrio cyclitrophicus]
MLSDVLATRNNNFNLIRVMLAVLVIYSHSYAIVYGFGATTPTKELFGFTLGDVAVNLFFIISGFLVSGSYYNSTALKFLGSRVLRIYPAIIVSTMVSILLIGPLVTEMSLLDYFLSSETFEFFVRNTTLIFGVSYTLPGVFSDVPYHGIVNGSLWSLPYEVKLYVILFSVLFASDILSRLTKKHAIARFLTLTIFLILVVMYSFKLYFILNETVVRLLCYFFSGVVFRLLSCYIRLNYFWLLLSLFSICIYLLTADPIFNMIYVPALSYLLLFIVYIPKGIITRFNYLGDYSYGLYIYGFVVQQFLIFQFDHLSVLELTFFSTIVSLVFSVASWHFIEYPMTKRKLSIKTKRLMV